MVVTLFITLLLVGLAVLIHFEALLRLSDFMVSPRHRFRVNLMVCIFGALFAHVIEVWVFGFGYYYLTGFKEFGWFEGVVEQPTLRDCGYYSFVTYTTLGFGDIIPKGPIRFLTGMEALTGLLLITWTASFMYLQMQRFWQTDFTK